MDCTAKGAGILGLLAGGPDSAVRLGPDANASRALQQVRFALQRQELNFCQAVPGARWWKIGPLPQAESTHVHGPISLFGEPSTDAFVDYAAASGLQRYRGGTRARWKVTSKELKAKRRRHPEHVRPLQQSPHKHVAEVGTAPNNLRWAEVG